MGIYWTVYDEPCPRCGEKQVGSTFISVSPMSFSMRCGGCGAQDFTDVEKKALGDGHPWYPGPLVSKELE